MKAYFPLVILWLAITIPVVSVGYFLYQHQKPVVETVTKTLVVQPTVVPTATPSATPKVFYKAPIVQPTVKGGVTK